MNKVIIRAVYSPGTGIYTPGISFPLIVQQGNWYADPYAVKQTHRSFHSLNSISFYGRLNEPIGTGPGKEIFPARSGLYRVGMASNACLDIFTVRAGTFDQDLFFGNGKAVGKPDLLDGDGIQACNGLTIITVEMSMFTFMGHRVIQ